MILSSIGYRRRLIGSGSTWTVTAALVVLAAAGPAWGQPNEVDKVTAEDGTANDLFGQAICLSGDTAIIGAYLDDHDGFPGVTNAGSAYIFQKDFDVPGEWGQVERLFDTDAFTDDRFGTSVSISGDIAIVGAPQDDDGGSNLGSAFIFYRDQGGPNRWGEVANITAPDANPNDQFGWSVSISGNIAIVGAPFVGDDVGQAYVFYRDQGGSDNWGWVATMSASDGASGDVFGWSVGVSGGIAVVGAPLEDEGFFTEGAAYVRYQDQGDPDNWGEVAKLTASDGVENDHFGISVAITGDTAIVGADGTNQAYIFDEDEPSPGDGWGEVTILSAIGGGLADAFGASVSFRGVKALVGAPANKNGRGAAYLFDRQDSWSQIKLTASDGADDDRFGQDVAIFGDFAVMGAPGDDDLGSSSGSGYVFEGVCPCPWDLTGNDKVGSADLLILLSLWGQDPGGPPDFDGNGNVGASDLLALLFNWGLCPCVEGTPPMSIEDEMADACLTMDDWDEFVDVMTDPESSEEDKDNYLCWMTHYLEDCTKCICICASGCPGPDPFD